MSKKVACIYHSRDLDGVCSAVIVKKYFEEKRPDDILELIGWDYGKPTMSVKTMITTKLDEIVFVDVMYPIEYVKEIVKLDVKVTVIDHHVSSIQDIITARKEGVHTEIAFPSFTVDDDGVIKVAKKAACELVWSFYYSCKKIPEFITLLGMYDSWRNDDKDQWADIILPFQYGAQDWFPLNPDRTEWVGAMRYSVIDGLVESGRSIMDFKSKDYAEQCKQAYEVDLQFIHPDNGVSAIMLNTQSLGSQVFESIWDENKYDIMIRYAFKQGKWSFSLYTTKGDVDCSVIAKSLGGGGHRQAAGFEIEDIEHFFEYYIYL